VAAEPTPIRLTDAQRFDWLRLIRSENVGPRTFRALLNSCGGAHAALRALPELARRGGARALRVASVNEIEQELEAARRIGARFVALGEAEYPPLLRQIDSAPPIIALRGGAEILKRPCVAIVGSRNASAIGLAFTERLAREIGASGYAIVSGLARGIDQRAHVASLETGTIAVLAGGLARPYPPEAAPLMEKIAAEGAVISEMPIEWEPRGRDFPRRNRIVSGLALGVVIVEAARGSGSLITARFAAEQGRAVLAVPGSPLDPRAEGTNDLIRNGATMCTRFEDALAELEPMRERGPPGGFREDTSDANEPLWAELALPGVEVKAAPRIEAGAEFDEAAAPAPESGDRAETLRARVISLLGPAPTPIDELVRAAQTSIRDVRVVLLELELAGRLEYSGGNRVALIDAPLQS
jgi:DNA processing protein